MIVQFTKSLHSVRHLPTKSLFQPLLLTQKRSIKQTVTQKRCPEKQKKSKNLRRIAAISVIGTGCVVIAAKNDEELREWTREHVPALDSLVKIVYKEEETYVELLVRVHKEVSEWVKNTLYNLVKGVKQPGHLKSGASLPETCEESKKPYKPPESAFIVKKEEDATENSSTSKRKTRGIPKNVKELKDLEDRLGRAAQDTIQSYHAAVCAMKEQAKLIDSIDELISKHDCDIWEKLRKKLEEEKKYLNKAESSLKNVESTGNKLKSCLEDDPDLTEDMKSQARNNLIIVMGDVNKAREHLDKQSSRMALAKRNWDKVRQARMHFSEELETLFPNIWLNDEKLNLPVDSLDPFIQDVLNKILFLDKELAKLQTVREAEVSSAIERYKTLNDPEGILAALVSLEAGKEKRLNLLEMTKALLTHQAKCDREGRAMMKQQAEVYNDLKVEAISLKEREVERKMQLRLEEELAHVRTQHKIEIAKMVGRIQGANEAITQRGGKDKGQQERQQFWSAAQSLLSAVKPIGNGKEPKPLKNEITTVTQAAPEGDDLVKAVIEGIPSQAVEHGVESEKKLRERFLTLEREARRVAGVPDGCVSLLQIFIARVQNCLYINEIIPQEELNNEPIDASSLNNYQVLQRARFFVDKGEFDQAIRYLNLLKGPSQKVASDWVKDVIVYLEMRQAAELLLAHAEAACL